MKSEDNSKENAPKQDESVKEIELQEDELEQVSGGFGEGGGAGRTRNILKVPDGVSKPLSTFGDGSVRY